MIGTISGTGLGSTDVSDRKDRGHVDSVDVRTPAAALFEATVSKPDGSTIDEAADALGRGLEVPPVFADQRERTTGTLEPLR